MKKFNVAVVGATGAVGEEMRLVLEERKFPVKKLSLLASGRSAGRIYNFRGEKIEVQELKEDSFKPIDIALTCIYKKIFRLIGKGERFSRFHSISLKL